MKLFIVCLAFAVCAADRNIYRPAFEKHINGDQKNINDGRYSKANRFDIQNRAGLERALNNAISTLDTPNNNNNNFDNNQFSNLNCPDNQVSHFGKCVAPEVRHNYHLFAPPQQRQNERDEQINIKPEVKFNHIFVKSPEQKGRNPVVIPPPQQKTFVYVLSKDQQQQRKVIKVPTTEHKPEVFYIDYKNGDSGLLPGGVNLKDALNQYGDQNNNQFQNNQFQDNQFQNNQFQAKNPFQNNQYQDNQYNNQYPRTNQYNGNNNQYNDNNQYQNDNNNQYPFNNQYDNNNYSPNNAFNQQYQSPEPFNPLVSTSYGQPNYQNDQYRVKPKIFQQFEPKFQNNNNDQLYSNDFNNYNPSFAQNQNSPLNYDNQGFNPDSSYNQYQPSPINFNNDNQQLNNRFVNRNF